MGASSYAYAELTSDQQLPNWIGVQVRAFEYMGGCPKLLIPDNTKTGVIRACRYDPDLNPTYQDMAMHYGIGVMPARPYKPRDKAWVSYCTSSRLSNDENWLLGPAASVALENRTLGQRFV